MVFEAHICVFYCQCASFNFRQSVITAMEERESQHSHGSERINQVQDSSQDMVRTRYGEIIITNNGRSSRAQTKQPTSAMGTSSDRPSLLSAGNRPQVQEIVIYQRSSWRTAWRTYWMIRCCIFIVFLIAGGGAGIGGYFHYKSKSKSTGSHYDSVPSETKHHYGKINYLGEYVLYF